MTTVTKSLNLRDNSNTEGKVFKRVKQLEAEGNRGEMSDALRHWVQSGYILDRLGHGFMQTLIAQDSAGVFEGMTQKEQSQHIANLISVTAWKEDAAPANAGGVSSNPAPKTVHNPAPAALYNQPESASESTEEAVLDDIKIETNVVGLD